MKKQMFIEIGTGGIYELTHKTGSVYTVKIHQFPSEGSLSIIDPKLKLSKDEFAMTESKVDKLLSKGRIEIIDQNKDE